MNIRPATPEDKQIILQLITKLAVYERKKPEEVQLTAAKIEEHGFGKYFDVVIIENKNKPIGYALYFFSYSASAGAPILYIEDLFIENEHRHQGFGKALLTHLADLAISNQCCRMEWHAFTWNESAITFYNNSGAIQKSDLLQFRLSGDSLLQLSKRNKP